MGQTKFTKGPWAATDCRNQKDGQIRIFRDPNAERESSSDARSYRCIANVLRTHLDVEANARLIAAAPDLYEACQAVLASGVRDIDPRIDYLEVQISRGDWEQLQAALAKAHPLQGKE